MGKSVYEMVTERVIEQLEKGCVPWQKPWSGIRAGAYNRISKKSYSLLNQMLLNNDGEYATFKQWQDLGGHVRRGEKAEFVVFWKILETEEKTDDGTIKKVNIPYLRYSNVFHISQVDGVKPLEKPFADVQPIEEADNIILNYVNREGIDFNETVSDRAFYRPSADMVVVPKKEQYHHLPEWYSTTFHEITHSTGHPSRLNRLKTGIVAPFGSETYSKEELIAELGAAFMLNRLGIETSHTFKNSTAYIDGWLEALKNDVKLIVSASSKAEKAVEYIYHG